MPYGTRVASLEAALGAPMTDARRAAWSRIPIDRDDQGDDQGDGHGDGDGDQLDGAGADGGRGEQNRGGADRGGADRGGADRGGADRGGAEEDGEVASAAESLRVLDEEHAEALRGDPVVPSRAELDEAYARGEAQGWDEQTARAWEYLDCRREIADERSAAAERGDTETVDGLDRRHAALDWNYLAVARTATARHNTADNPPEPVESTEAAPVGEPSEGRAAADAAADGVPECAAERSDLGALRERVAALRVPADHDISNEQARRAQLAQWADDDRTAGGHSSDISGSNSSDTSGDGDGA